MSKPIRITAVDKTDEEVRARHADIEDRLEKMGIAKIRILFERSALPTEWTPIILAWLANDRLEKETKKSGGD